MNKLFILSLPFILAAIVLSQSGCNTEVETDPLPDVTANADTIVGTVKYKQVDSTGIRLVDWHFGPAMVRANNIATAALGSDGRFIMILPKTVSGLYFTSMADFAAIQGGTFIVTPESVNFMGPVKFMVDYTDKGEAKSFPVNLSTFVLVNNKPVVSKSYFYNFYDQNGSFTGTGYMGNSFSWIFTKGWGMVESNATTTGSISKSISSAPVNAVWTN